MYSNSANLYLQKFEPSIIHPIPPSYFKCCTLEDVNFEQQTIQLVFPNWPVALVGDGCAVNKAAVDKLTEKLGLLSPGARCSGHAADGSIKRLTSSKTMSVAKVVTYSQGLRPMEYIHEIPDGSNGNDHLDEFDIQIKYPPKLQCTEAELVAEFSSIWSSLNKTWLSFKKTNPEVTCILRFWKHILTEFVIQYPNL